MDLEIHETNPQPIIDDIEIMDIEESRMMEDQSNGDYEHEAMCRQQDEDELRQDEDDRAYYESQQGPQDCGPDGPY